MNREQRWQKMYNLAKAYYEHYGNLQIPKNYKTKNGYEYDENGENLGKWISKQREAYKGARAITEYRIKKLDEIEMIWGVHYESFERMYNLAKAYYEHYGNLKVPSNYKTKNGYEYDEKGENLGLWIINKRRAYKGNGTGVLTRYQTILLDEIEMIWDTYDESFERMYKLAKAYYEHYGNLKVPSNYKTKNGYEYDEKGENLGNWISKQKEDYKGKRPSADSLSEYKIAKLEQIEMVWFSVNIDKKRQAEKITEKNIKRKQMELLNRLRSYLITINENQLNSKEKINSGFLKRLG